MKTLKIINIFMTFALIITVTMTLLLSVEAASGSLVEQEPNNSYTTAKWTYDDFDTRGSIGYSGDSDWWKITFDEEGMANFWLGDIPSGCNYQLYVYPGSIFSDSVAYSAKTGNSQELVRCHVEPGITYYVRIHSASGFSNANYLLRIKNYDITNGAKVFTASYIYPSYDYAPDESYDSSGAQGCATYIQSMGYDVTTNLVNTTAYQKYQQFPTSMINVVACHGYAGCIFSTNTLSSALAAEYWDSLPDDSFLMETYSYNQLANTYLSVYGTCYSGETDPDMGNLVDMTLNKGGMVAIGWTTPINTLNTNLWIELFFSYVSDGLNVYNAIQATNEEYVRLDAVDNIPDFDMRLINNIYYGNSAITSLVLATGQ